VTTVAAFIALASGVAGCGASRPAPSSRPRVVDHATRAPTHAERAAIVRWIKYRWRSDPQFSAARVGRHPIVKSIRISRRDSHFASAAITPLDSHGKQTLETSDAALMLAGGDWYVVLNGTDLSPICSGPSPQPLVDLFCRR